MDLKSGGMMIKLLLVLGLFAACATEVVIEDIQDDILQDDIAPYPYLESSDDEEASAEDVAEIRDVYVVTENGTPDYVEFVQEALESNLKADGFIYVKVAGEELQLVKEDDGLESIHLTRASDGPPRTVFQETVDVLVRDEVRYHIMLLIADTSAAVEEQEGLDSLLALIHANSTRVDILTMEPDKVPTSKPDEQGVRVKRQTSGQPSVYQQIATASGGMVITTTKNNILAVTNLLKQSIKANPVDIMRFQWPGSKAGQHFQIPVDDTMTQMTLQIQTPSARPMAMLTYPTGSRVPPTAGQMLGSALQLFEFNMTKKTPDYGQWKVVKIGRSDWDVMVTGQSQVGFTSEFMEPGANGFGMYPIKGRPIAGKIYQFVAHVPNYDKIKSVNLLMPLGNDNMPVGMPTMIHSVGGRRGKSTFTANFTMPPQDFKVAIDGMDKSNNQVRRLNPIMIFPISVDLIIPPMAGAHLYVNENLTVPFTVINTASKIQDVLIKLEDDKGFAQSPINLFYTMKGGENATKYFQIIAGSTPGVTVTVTVTAKPYIKGQVTKGQYQIRRFTVEKRKSNDTTDPTCTITSTTGKCNYGSDVCACKNHTWTMEVKVADSGDGLQNIFPGGAGSKNSYTFHNDSYNVGDKGPIKAKISADCCNQLASIQVEDKAGNTGNCTPNITPNFKPPNLSICNKTNINQTIGCTSQTQTGKCNFGTDPCDCHTMTWDIEVEFNKTNNMSLTDAYTINAGFNNSLKRVGQKVTLHPDCCQQHVTIVGEDFAGNLGECNISLSGYTGVDPTTCTSTSPTTSTTTTTTTPGTTTTSKNTTTSAGSSAGSSSSGTATTKPGTSGTATSAPGSSVTSSTGGKTGSASSGSSSGATSSPGGSSSHGATTKPGSTGGTPKPGTTGGGTPKPGSTSGTAKPGSTGPGKPSTSGGTTVPPSKTAKQVNDDGKSGGVPESAVAAGMTVGAIGALSAVAVMAVLFRRAAGKAAKSVDPHGRSRRTSYDRRDSAWS